MSITLAFYPGVVHSVVAPIDNGINPVSAVFVSQFNVPSRISVQKPVQWKVIAYGISATFASNFDTLKRVHNTGRPITYGVVKPVVWPLDYRNFIPSFAFNVYRRIPSSLSFKWKIAQRKPVTKKFSFSTLASFYVSRPVRFNVYLRVRKPGVTLGSWVNQVDDIVSRPLSYQNFTVSPAMQWNAELRVSKKRAIRFNDLYRFKLQKSFSFTDHAISVSRQVSSAWNLKRAVVSRKSSSWATVGRPYKRKVFSWNTRSSLVTRKAFQFRTTDHVTVSSSFNWNLGKRFFVQKTSRWKVLYKVPSWKAVRFNTESRVVFRNWKLTSASPGSIASAVVHPIDSKYQAGTYQPFKGLAEPVVQPVSASLYQVTGQVANPGIAFRVGINPAGRVSCQHASSFKVLEPVTVRFRSSWGTVGRFGIGTLSQFNIYNSVTAGIIIKWNVGMWVSGHIRQTAQVRTDFAY